MQKIEAPSNLDNKLTMQGNILPPLLIPDLNHFVEELENSEGFTDPSQVNKNTLLGEPKGADLA